MPVWKGCDGKLGYYPCRYCGMKYGDDECRDFREDEEMKVVNKKLSSREAEKWEIKNEWQWR